MRYIQDPDTYELIPADQYVEPEKPGVAYVVPDLQPYKSVAWDKETKKPMVIGGRKQHREFLRRNGYEEVGNG